MDTEKVLEILQKKYDENAKAHEEMKDANNSAELIDVIRTCEKYFRGLKDSKEDSLLKHNWFCNEWFDDSDKFHGYEVLRELLDEVNDQIYFEIISDCQFIEEQISDMIKEIKAGKDVKSYYYNKKE